MMEDYNYLLKISIVGDHKVGKLSLTQINAKSGFEENYRMTTGADIYSKTISMDIGGRLEGVRLIIWVTSSAKWMNSIISMYIKGSDGLILIFDLTNRDSFKHLVSWIYEILKYRKRETSIILVGNKCDLVDERNVPKKEVDLFRKTFKLEYFETSNKNGNEVNEVFYTLTRLILANLA